jgi:hypothetical protein
VRAVPSAVTIVLHFSCERGNSGGCCISNSRGCCCHACHNHPDEKWEMHNPQQWAPMQEWVDNKTTATKISHQCAHCMHIKCRLKFKLNY